MKHSITIPCAKSNLQQVRNFIIEILKAKKLSDLEIHSMVLAVDEVCANIIIHSNNCSPEQTLEVTLEIKNDRVEYEVIDNGIGFDIRKYPEPDLDEIIKTKRKGGVGLMLVKRIMDEIDFYSRKGKSIVKLTKYLEASS
jgi:serine/threonine-protein kinase RsbW